MLYEIVERLNIDRHWHSRLVLVADMFVTLFASVCAVTFISVVSRHAYAPGYIILWIVNSFVGSLLVFLSLHTNTSLLRHSSLREVGFLLLSVLLKELFIGVVMFLGPHLRQGFSNTHLFALLCADLLFSLSLLVIDRIFVVVCYDVLRQRAQRRRKNPEVLVYGTDDASVSFAQLQALHPHYHVVGFLQYGNRPSRTRIADKRVYLFSDLNTLRQLVDLHAVDAVVFTSRQQMNEEDSRLVRFCHQIHVRILFAPPLENMSDEKRSYRRVREVRIEDLLGRPEICINTEAAMKQFHDRVILVTGAAGSIGSELCHQLAMFGPKLLVLFDSAETPMHNLRLELEEQFPDLKFVPVIGDARFRHKLDSAFRSYRPQVVFHAAAYKHVPLMEENPCEAVHANVMGTRNVADKCLQYDVEKMVMISTDKAVNPTNIMGCSKRLAEIYVQSLALAVEDGKVKGRTRFVTTRFGNVLGSNGSVIPRFREQIAKGGPLTVTHPDITRFFMTIPEACRLVIEAATMGIDNKIFVFDMGASVKIADMARRMIELAGYVPDVDIKIEYTGLRPGEKLYEEVLSTTENTIPTGRKKIYVAKVREYDYFQVARKVDALCQMCRDMNEEKMVWLMKHLVPEYKSKNSRFEKFDRELEAEIIRLQEEKL